MSIDIFPPAVQRDRLNHRRKGTATGRLSLTWISKRASQANRVAATNTYRGSPLAAAGARIISSQPVISSGCPGITGTSQKRFLYPRAVLSNARLGARQGARPVSTRARVRGRPRTHIAGLFRVRGANASRGSQSIARAPGADQRATSRSLPQEIDTDSHFSLAHAAPVRHADNPRRRSPLCSAGDAAS